MILRRRRSDILPGISDVRGAARGIATLWVNYRYDDDILSAQLIGTIGVKND